MAGTDEEEVLLPDDYCVRLMDLNYGTGAMIAEDNTGFVNVYVNARFGHDAQRHDFFHEVAHYQNDDLHSDVDIHDAEARADATARRLAPAHEPARPKRVEKRRFKPTDINRDRARTDLMALKPRLLEAVHIFDVIQAGPLCSAEALSALARGLGEEDIASIRTDKKGTAVLRFCREEGGILKGALFYDPQGLVDSALAVFQVGEARTTIDLRRRGATLEVAGIVWDDGQRMGRVY